MIRNYFKIAIRSLIRNKAFTIINTLGLVLGMAFSTMLYQYVRHELSYDTSHPYADRTYRILTVDKSDAELRTYGVTVPALGPQLVNTFPEVETMVRLHKFSGQVIVDVNGEKFNERNYFITSDPNLFDVFNVEFKEGDPATSLVQPRTAILTASTARRYFGDASAVNKTITVANIGDVKVTGVIQDHPDNTHLQFDLLLTSSYANADWNEYLNSWKSFSAFTYVVLKPGQSQEAVMTKMDDFMKVHNASGIPFEATLQPIEDIYLHSENILNGSEAEHGQPAYIFIFSTMALFLLVIAAINYINLTTSTAQTRAREIGIRKVAGAVKTQLFFQFITETFLITLAAMVLALVVIDLAFPYFNNITGKDFDLNLGTLKDFLPALLMITLIIGVMAGTYPAFYLARLQPIATLKSRTTGESSKVNLRTVLVVFQFCITITMIVATLVIGRQMNFIRTKDMGFNKERLMIIDINSGNVRKQFQTMKTEFAKLAGVEGVAVSTRVPGEWKNIAQVFAQSEATSDSLQTYFMGFDEDMLDTYKLKLATGNFFTGSQSDSAHVLINSAAVKAMNLTNPIGNVIRISTENGEWSPRVIGVLNDFHFQSLHQKISPIVIGYQKNPIQPIDYFTLKVAGDMNTIIEGATAIHNQFDQATPIEYHFLSEQLNTFYHSEQRVSMIFNMAGVLSMIVACLGLLGLVNYHIHNRTKELGIRKVLGANSLNLFILVCSSFTRQIAIAFVLACPVAWYMMKEWLSRFEYRILLNAGTFILAGLIVFALALATVSYQSLKAAFHNPVDSLKND